MTCIGRLTTELQRSPTDTEIAADLHIEIQEVHRVLLWAQRDALSLEAPRGDKGDVCLADLIVDVGSNELDDANTADVVANEAEHSLFIEQLDGCIQKLPPGPKQVLRLRFNIWTDEEHTRREVAAELGISQERVRQVEVAAIERLKQMPEFRRITLEYVKGRSRANS